MMEPGTSTSAPTMVNPCRVCGAAARHVFTLQVLRRVVGYFECSNCGYLQTQQPDWLADAYARPINDVDTGIMMRNRDNLRRVVMTLFALGSLRGRVIDYAAGYGILVRLLRDAGVDARWSDKYCENLLARGFETDGGRYDLLTAFEVFEHVLDPLAELKAMLETAPTVMLSTELITQRETPPQDWWYLGPEHGQHIGFFRVSTLQWMAATLKCHLATDGRSVHLFSKVPLPVWWLPLLRLRRLSVVISRLRLKPKTQQDHERLRGLRG